jgi:hypothetical protein
MLMWKYYSGDEWMFERKSYDLDTPLFYMCGSSGVEFVSIYRYDDIQLAQSEYGT